MQGGIGRFPVRCGIVLLDTGMACGYNARANKERGRRMEGRKTAIAVKPGRREGAAVAVALCLALGLGFSHLAEPSFWHDELVHVFVARHIAAEGWPALPSGMFYPSSMAYNYLLGGVAALFGDGETAMRAPSVLLSAVSVFILYALTRRLLGRATALVAAYALALSPWHVAWARQARMYELQAAAYLLLLWLAWAGFSATSRRRAVVCAAGAVFAYFLGVFTSYHSLLALGAVGGYAVLMALYTGQAVSRYSAAALLCLAAGLLTLAGLWLNPNPVDQAAVFQTGLGGYMPDPQRLVRLYYVRWLGDNLSVGFLLLALIGTGLAIWKSGHRGLFLVLGFWAPVFVLTFLIGYRRPRFMYFAFPLYVALFSHGMTLLPRALMLYRHARFDSAASAVRGVLAYAGAVAVFLFCLRLGVSAERLISDSIDAARGAPTTLAVHHQNWKPPCGYVREHRAGEAVLATSVLPVLYYVGHVDDWFPNRYTLWEYQESGKRGLGSLAELQAFVEAHPKGYFIAEAERFEKWRHHGDLPDLAREVGWVRDNMRRIEAGCSADVTLYAWGGEIR